MIIDIHAHTSNHALWNLHTADASIAELKRLAKSYGIARIYLMATYFPLKNSGLHNLDLWDRIERESLFGCFGSLNLEDHNLNPALLELRGMAKKGWIEGIKLYPGYQRVILSSPRFNNVYRLAQEFSLPVAVHLGELHHCCPKDKEGRRGMRCRQDDCPLDHQGELSQPEQLLRVAREFPHVNFIACHLANPYFENLRQVMRRCPNISTDISGQFVSGSDEDTPKYRRAIVKEIDRFLEIDGGAERVMFGTDFPIQSYQDTFELLRMLNLKPEVERMVLSGNAKRLFPALRKDQA
jgi:uncharacterized protein